MQAEPRARREPDWVRQSIDNARSEIATYLTTFLALLRGPLAFAERWAAGDSRALNPLAFALNSLAVLGAYAVLMSRLTGVRAPGAPVWIDFARSAVFLTTFALSAPFFQLAARLAGSSARFTSSLALSLYVGAGPGVLSRFFVYPLQDLRVAHRLPSTLPAELAGLLQIVVVLVYSTRAQRGLHRVGWGWLIAAYLLFIIADVGAQDAVFRYHPDWLAWMLS